MAIAEAFFCTSDNLAYVLLAASVVLSEALLKKNQKHEKSKPM